MPPSFLPLSSMGVISFLPPRSNSAKKLEILWRDSKQPRLCQRSKAAAAVTIGGEGRGLQMIYSNMRMLYMSKGYL